jgi:hypothetical protein
MFGPGIYFAGCKEDAHVKALHGKDVTIVAVVWLGFTLEVPSARNDLTREAVYNYGCHSVHGKTRSTGDEWVIFDTQNILSLERLR